MTPETKEIIKRLKECVEKSNLTYLELEKRTGIAKSSLQRYVSGTTKKIPVDSIQIIAKAIGVSPEYILGWDESNTEIDLSSIKNIEPLPKMKKVPLLGTIACGEPILAEENIEDYIDMPQSAKGTFALRCKGDSMINARILDGDIVYIHEQPQVENGEIAAVLIDNEATLKRVYYYPDKNMIILKAANPMYDDFVYSDKELNNIKILGKVVAFFSNVK